MIILKANPGILKRGGGIKMRMWLCVERGSYLRFGNSRSEEDRNKYWEAKNDAKIVVYVAMNQKAREAVWEVDSCRDGRELFSIGKQRVGGKKDVAGVSCLKDESGAVKISVNDQKKIR